MLRGVGKTRIHPIYTQLMKNDRKLTYICRITTFKGGYFIERKKNVKYNWIEKIKKQKNIRGNSS